MSEDDNTNGADDSAYSSNVIINHQPSLTEELNISVPTSTSHTDQCHITNISDASSDLSSPCNTTPAHQYAHRNYQHDVIHGSSGHISDSIATVCSVSTGTSPRKSNETSYEAAVTSTMMEDEREVRRYRYKRSSRHPSPFYDPEPTDLSINRFEQQKCNNNQNSSQSLEKVLPVLPVMAATPKPDISGLELLSNSIEAFEKSAFIKAEPLESPIALEAPSLVREESKADECPPCPVPPVERVQPEFVESGEQLGGLNLLCALAEQRFQEEVGHRSDRKRSSSSETSEPKRKKHKDKHSSKKTKKRDRKEKKRRSSSVVVVESDDKEPVVDDIVEKDLKETYDRVKSKYMKCTCRKDGTVIDENCCCRTSTSWPTPEEVYSAMKSDMRNRLVEITREVQEKKRKLDAMNNKESRRHRESTPSSSKSSSSFSKLTASLPTLSPSVLSTSSLDCNQNGNVDFGAASKVSSDTDSSSSTSSKQKAVPDTMAKKSTSLVGYIFASKKRQNDAKFDSNFSTTDEASINSDISASLKRVATIKQESFDFEDSSSQPESTSNPFNNVSAEDTAAATVENNQNIFSAGVFGTKEHKRKHCTSPKHHKKSKSNKDRKHHRRSSEMRERRRRIDERCTLTGEHLNQMIAKPKERVLTAMGGLFYAGCLSAVQPPDVYAVTLDGERGNRPHILSREEILRDAVG